MARNFWRGVFAMQVALAVGIALSTGVPGSANGVWIACAIAGGAFVTLQYLLVFLVRVTSVALAGSSAHRSHPWDAARAVLSEPVYFALAELSMARGARARVRAAATAERGAGPLLLVHGLACNSGIWRWLLPRLRAAGFAPIHSVDLEPIMGDIDSLTRKFAHELSGFHRAQGGVPVTVLAHSMGGLICRAALRELDPRMVRQLVTIATPHHGAAIARVLRTAPVSQMRVDSPWLAAINAAQEGRLPVPVTSVFSRDDNFVAPASSAELAGARHHALDGLGHFGLLVSRRALDRVLFAMREAA